MGYLISSQSYLIEYKQSWICLLIPTPSHLHTKLLYYFGLCLGFSLYNVSWSYFHITLLGTPSFCRTTWTCHNLLICSTTNAHSGSFHTSTTINNAAINNIVMGYFIHISVQFSRSDSLQPMNCSIPGLPIHHQLPEFTQTHVHCVGDAIQPSHPLSSPSLPALKLSQHQGLFKWALGGQSIAVSASASVLPMNIQDCFPLGWTGWISLQFKGL